MKFIYPAIFEKVSEHEYKGRFPDLEDCYGTGETLMDAIEDARQSAFNWIAVELEDPDGNLPPVTDECEIELKENECVRNILVHFRFYEGWDE
ncbi:MAG: type II toxin-antitoxin system HicB family antitoxin [Hespellia sp.]|nr:type II toxin-antitoxin system HicB family antitoxin [Hespellia sp.]